MRLAWEVHRDATCGAYFSPLSSRIYGKSVVWGVGATATRVLGETYRHGPKFSGRIRVYDVLKRHCQRVLGVEA